MRKLIHHIIFIIAALLGHVAVNGQVSMPDTVCVGTSRVYKVNDASTPSTYTWKIDGVTQAGNRNDMSITWNNPGIFQVTVQEHSATGCDGDIRSGLVYVNPLPQPNAGPDASICFGVPYRLNGSGGNIYQWSPSTYLSDAGVANPVAVLPAPGVYQYLLNVSSNGCKSVLSDTVRIKVLPPARVFAGNDTLIAAGQPLQLNAVDANGTGLSNYAWTPSFGLNNALIKNPVATLTQGITYIVNASSPEGCRASDNIKVTVFLAPEIYVPNAFTPNDDGSNDIFKPILVGIKELIYFSVYNRYGQLVYTTAVQGKGWDGRVGAVMQNTGAFAWMAEAIDYQGNTIKRKGSVILIK